MAMGEALARYVFRCQTGRCRAHHKRERLAERLGTTIPSEFMNELRSEEGKLLYNAMQHCLYIALSISPLALLHTHQYGRYNIGKQHFIAVSYLANWHIGSAHPDKHHTSLPISSVT